MIRKISQFLFGWPCDHDWEVLVKRVQYEDTFTSRTGGEVKKWGYIWVYRCKTCCKMKEIRT